MSIADKLMAIVTAFGVLFAVGYAFWWFLGFILPKEYSERKIEVWKKVSKPATPRKKSMKSKEVKSKKTR